ncbi:MAG: hypothetical protein KDA52_21110 [Planctomycetaceae bacterium]|nr:hypothetical protein [Planctomycetaceae bacterium]
MHFNGLMLVKGPRRQTGAAIEDTDMFRRERIGAQLIIDADSILKKLSRRDAETQSPDGGSGGKCRLSTHSASLREIPFNQ